MAETAIDHKAFLATLPADTRLKLLDKSDVSGLMHLAGHWGAILLVGGLIALKIPFWLLLIPIQGVLIIFNFTLMHECTHQTPFRSRWLNEGVGRICGLSIAMPFLWFRYFHLAHHRHTHDPAKDPELAAPKPETRWDYAKVLSGLPVWWSQIKTLIINAQGKCADDFVPTSALKRVRNESLLIVIFYIVIAVYSPITLDFIITVWILPVFIGQPFLRLFLLAEHGRCPHVANMFENTRTTLTTTPVRALTWNMPYHVEHHSYPQVPFHRLPQFHHLIRTHIQTLENGYVRFHHSYISNLK